MALKTKLCRRNPRSDTPKERNDAGEWREVSKVFERETEHHTEREEQSQNPSRRDACVEATPPAARRLWTAEEPRAQLHQHLKKLKHPPSRTPFPLLLSSLQCWKESEGLRQAQVRAGERRCVLVRVTSACTAEEAKAHRHQHLKWLKHTLSRTLPHFLSSLQR